MSIHRFLRGDEGQTTVFFAVMMTIIIALVGLSVDVGNLCFAENKLHTAAEAASLSGALEIGSCNGVNNCSAMQTAATTAVTENGFAGSALVTNCGSTSNTALTLLLNNPPCLKGSADPNQGKSKYVEAVVSMPVQTYFVRLIGYTSVLLTARSESVRTSNPNCIYALDQTGPNAITVGALASLTATCGVVDESNSSTAFGCALFGAVSVPNLKITGGLTSFLCSVNPAPRTNVPIPNPADPLSTLPKPTVLSCGASVASPFHGSANPLVILGPAVLYPDAAYCGGITIGPLANVTFMPGTYVIRAGGALGTQGGVTFDLLSTATGNGVTFYNYGPYGGINFAASAVTLGHFTLTAPTSGTYAGILFFQDPGDTAPAVILANSSLNATMTGAYYFPTAAVTCAVSGSSTYNILVAKDITFAALTFSLGTFGSTSFNNNYSSLANGSPLAGGGSALVQ